MKNKRNRRGDALSAKFVRRVGNAHAIISIPSNKKGTEQDYFVIKGDDLVKDLFYYLAGDTILAYRSKIKQINKQRIKADVSLDITPKNHHHLNYNKAWRVETALSAESYGVPVGTELYFLHLHESPSVGDRIIGMYKNAFGKRPQGVVSYVGSRRIGGKDVPYVTMKTDSGTYACLDIKDIGYIVKN